MSEEIENAIKLLRHNGYVVKKITRVMERDSKECDEMSERGENVDCCCCTCSICIMQ